MKTHLFLIIAFVLLAGSLSAQDNKASVSLTAAIYEEEVSGNLDKAVELYLNILKKYPDDRQVAAKTLYHLGLVNEKMGKQKADEYFTRLVNTYPDQTEMVALAKAKLTLYNNVTSGNTLKAGQSFKLAADLFKQFKYEAAVAEYEKVIKLAPKSQLAQEAQLRIGQCYFKEGKNEQALKSLNTIAKEYPGSTILPVTELMIGQVQLTIAKEPKKSTVISLDDKTILDTVAGVRYTRINSWAGKNDIIKSAIDITDISPGRKFILYENKVVPFDHSDSFTLFDTLSFYHNSRLSPDGKQVVFFTKNGLSVIPVSPETGQPAGPAQKLFDKTILNGFDISWSHDGNNILFSIEGEDEKISIWEFSIKNRSLKQVTNPSIRLYNNMFYSKNDSNLLYQQCELNDYSMKMKAINGKSLILLDSVSGFEKKFILSPDNQWIMYYKVGDKKMLYRLADKQQKELITPEEVGDFVSWADDGSKAFFYRPSAEKKDVMKVATVFGGSAFEIGASKGGINLGWSPDSREIVVVEGLEGGEQSLKMINLINQDSKVINGIENFGVYPLLSPDCSKILMGFNKSRSPMDLSIVPISLKDGKITGKPILIYKGFSGYPPLDCSWSPDGRKIAICDRGDVWICDTEGYSQIQLTKTPVTENGPLWSPDGNYIYVFIVATDQLQVLKALDGKVIKTFEKTNCWEWTPDGKELTIAYEDGQLNNVSLETGKSRKICNWKEITHCTNLDDLKWSPDGKWLALNGYVNGPEYITPLYILNANDGKVTQVEMEAEEYKELIKWSPDSKWISYYSFEGTYKNRLESILWEADLTGFMKKMKHGKEKGFTTDFDFKTPGVPVGEVAPDGTFTDSRDGHVYKYKKIGNQTWMTENLGYLPEVNPGSATSLIDKRYYVYGYGGSDVKEAKNSENYQKFGVLYNWPAAVNGAIASNSAPIGVQGVCPAGWHLPSDAEWMILERNLGMSEEDLKKEGLVTRLSGTVGAKLKSLTGWEDDNIYMGQSGFNAMPGGLNYYGKALALNQTVYFWTSTSLSETKATYRNAFGAGVYRSQIASKGLGLYIRCVKD